MMQLKQYRDPWLAEKFDEFIGFYPREWFVLDNFSSFGIDYKGYRYPTVEHAYQSLKFETSCPELAARIRDARSAHEAQKLAYSWKDMVREDWEDIKVAVMMDLLRTKLVQNPYVAKKLLQTKDYSICEDSPKDSFWGIGPNRDGQNQLGKLWMKLRGELEDRIQSETNIFLESIRTQVNRNPHLRAARIIVQALTEVAYVRQDVAGARKQGYGYCATHLGNVKRHLETILLNVYGEDELRALVNSCNEGCYMEKDQSTELIVELLLEWTPHILLKFKKPIAEYYQSEPERTED